MARARTKHMQSEQNNEGMREKQERCIVLGEYIIEKNATVREAAKVFGISKSTVHQDVTTKLNIVNPILALEVKKVLEKNKEERHVRGGMATKQKYIDIKKS